MDNAKDQTIIGCTCTCRRVHTPGTCDDSVFKIGYT